MLAEYAERGIETAFVAGLGGYVEFDAEEMLQFHRQERQASTRAFNERGALDFLGDKTAGNFDCAGDPLSRLSAVWVREPSGSCQGSTPPGG